MHVVSAHQSLPSSKPLITAIFKKHVHALIATGKGRINQERANLQSSKTNTTKQVDYEDPNCFPTAEPNRTNDVVATIVPVKERNTAYSDLTGKFPHKSSRGNEYISLLSIIMIAMQF